MSHLTAQTHKTVYALIIFAGKLVGLEFDVQQLHPQHDHFSLVASITDGREFKTEASFENEITLLIANRPQADNDHAVIEQLQVELSAMVASKTARPAFELTAAPQV